MAEIRESFPSLEDASGVGAPLSKAVNATTDPTGLSGSIGFSFKDSLGNVILPTLDGEGRLPVSLEGAGIEKSAVGVLAAGSATMVLITGASITLTVNKIYTQIRANVSCFRDAVYNVIHSDNAVETIIGKIRVGSGQYTFEWTAGKKYVTAGATGVQLLLIKGQNQNTQSEMSCELSCVESV